MDRIIGRVEIDDYLVGRRGIRVQEGVDEELPDLPLVPLDALVAVGLAACAASQLQAVQGALDGQRILIAIAAAHDAEEWIGAPQVVAVETLATVVYEAAGEGTEVSVALLNLRKQEQPAVA